MLVLVYLAVYSSFSLLVCSAWVHPLSTLSENSWAPRDIRCSTLPVGHCRHRRAITLSLSSSRNGQHDGPDTLHIAHLRVLLDETVSLYHELSSRRQGHSSASDHDDSRLNQVIALVCDVSTALHEADAVAKASRRANLDEQHSELSQQLDQIVMNWKHGVSDKSDLMTQVESIAAQYYRECVKASEGTLSNPLAAQLRWRLDDLKNHSTSGSFVPRPKTATSLGVVNDRTSSPSKDSKGNDELESIQNEMLINIAGEAPIDRGKPDTQMSEESSSEADVVDVAIVGAGIGGLCAGAILNTLYGKKVGIYESHYLAGGCAHAFDRIASNGETFTFDSGPTILLGCSAKPFNPLRQVLNAVGQDVEWIRYGGWGMVERPGQPDETRWKFELGQHRFEDGPLQEFGGEKSLKEFTELRAKTAPLVRGAVDIPAMAMRPGNLALVPLLRYLPSLLGLIQQGDLNTGVFAPFIDGPLYMVTDPWLRSWLDALAFSLSGLPASRTAAAAMAYVLYDMHRPEASLDYPKGGLGSVVDALVRAVEQGDNASAVHLRRHVESIDFSGTGNMATGLTLRGGKKVTTRDGVVCNAPVWALHDLIKNNLSYRRMNNYLPGGTHHQRRRTWSKTDDLASISSTRPLPNGATSFFAKTESAEMTGSFLHLHLALDSNGLDLDSMEAHYTVMDKGLLDSPCGELNMIAVSNPCVIDRSLAPKGYIVIHAYGAANEPYDIWKSMKTSSDEYKSMKEHRAEVLYRAVESVIPDLRDRVVLELIGSPLTHERFLRRLEGTYGAATEDYLRDGRTPIENLVLAGDAVFPGIGIPAVALNGASAANSFVSLFRQWNCLDRLKL